MRDALGLDENHSFQMQNLTQDARGQTHVRFRQLYHGVRIWGGEVITHTKADGKELPPTSALKQDIKVDIEPKLSVADALTVVKTDLAPRFDFAYKPVIELVVYPEKTIRVLARKALVPEKNLNAEDFVTGVKGYQLAYYIHTEQENRGDTRHTDYLVNAQTGAIIEKWDSLLSSNAIGTGKSQYNGTVSLNANSVTSGFELRDLTRPVSGGNVIYNLDHFTAGTGTISTDSDNTWGDGANFKEDPEPTTSANGQTAAVDAAYGLQATWDMYKNVFGRNGINGSGTPTYARVHYDSAYNNAFYSDQCMCITYGDGTKLQTLTSLDVAAHEFSHGVCIPSAGLIYNKESGGLNEANSDIMGAMAEFYMRGANGKGSVIPDTGGTWTQGEQITTPAYPLKMRFLYKPSKDGKSADAWSPTLQNLNVHYSSGPMNRAFYFLSQGATKTGETSTTFLPQGMTGIGNDKAAKIWFHALTNYMTPDTNYAAARIACIQAVRDLFPISGPEEIALWNAFAGINVGSPWTGGNASPVTLSFALHVETRETSTGVARDTFAVQIRNSSGAILKTLATYSNLNAATGYKVYSFDLAEYKGQTIQLYFLGAEDAALSTGFILDKVNLMVTGGDGGVDKEAPVVSAGESGSSGAITFSATASGNVGVTKVELYVDGALKGTDGTSPYNMTLDSKTLTDTSHTLVAKAYDAAGNIGVSTPVTFFIDNTSVVDREPPITSVSESGTSGTITFSATATDNIGVTKVAFFVDNTLKGTDTTAPYSMTLDSLTLINGNYALMGKAYDAAGNIGISTSVPFIVNNGSTPTTYKEVESNGTPRIANVIADTVTKITGFIGTSTDQDYFKINVAAGRTVTVSMTGPAKDYDLFLVSSSGTTLKTSANVSATEFVTYTNSGTTTATYYIKVVAFGGAYTSSTPYSLVLSR